MEKKDNKIGLLTRIKNRLRTWAYETWLFATSRIFIINFAGMLGVVVAFAFLSTQFLTCYTKHGESIEMPNYVNMSYQEVERKAADRGFQIVVADSSFVVGKPPFTVLEQNPKPGAMVKEDRTIYLVINRAQADMVLLPDLTGGNDDFEAYKRKLTLLGIQAQIVGTQFDAKLEPNTILEIIYQNDTITDRLGARRFQTPRGSSLQFIVSSRESTDVTLPDLVCKRFDAAKFLISNYNLTIGNVIKDKTITDENRAYVYKQEPAFEEGKIMRIGEQINVYISQKPLPTCNVAEDAAPTGDVKLNPEDQ